MRQLQPLRFVDAVARAGSIRKAAQALAVNSTALNRRILALEEELGVPIFERLPRGVRLNPAGELLVYFIRNQISDYERLRSQIADLSGVRRGHVSVAGARAALPHFLPEQIARYRREHPAVTFAIRRMSSNEAEEALLDHSVELALLFEPLRRSEVQTIVSVRQRLMAIMPEGHELAARREVRLRDCLQHPIGLPFRASGVRHLIDVAAARTGLSVRPTIESEDANFLISHARIEGSITFGIPIGFSPDWLASQGMTARPLDRRDTPDGRLYLVQLRGRALPVAAARFADQVSHVLELEYADAE